jgi:hypothetical protein
MTERQRGQRRTSRVMMMPELLLSTKFTNSLEEARRD